MKGERAILQPGSEGVVEEGIGWGFKGGRVRLRILWKRSGRWKNSSCMFVGVRLRFGGWKCSGVEEQIVQVFLSCD